MVSTSKEIKKKEWFFSPNKKKSSIYFDPLHIIGRITSAWLPFCGSVKGRYKLKQELNEGTSPKCKMYLQRDVTAHWLPSRGIFPSLQAWARQTWKEREINQCSETLAQPTATCSSSLKDQFVSQSSDNSSFPHCGFSQMWYKPPASPSLLHHLWHQPKFKNKGGNKEFLL